MISQKLDISPSHYVSVHTPSKACQGYILYIHGGPGGHSAYFERALQDFSAYQNLPYGWICFDQRNCGRSPQSDIVPVTHQQNKDDIVDLIDALQKMGYPLLAVMGHSYGGRLAYELCIEKTTNMKNYILLGRAEDSQLSFRRSVYIDLLLLKIFEPEKYQSLWPQLTQCETPDLTTLKMVRGKMNNVENRKLFYWGNLEALRWFDAIKEEIGLSDNNEVYDQVVASFLPADKQENMDINKLTGNILWVNGWHDYLMGGDTLFGQAQTNIKIFKGSGHYPQYEEPELFVRTLLNFISFENEKNENSLASL